MRIHPFSSPSGLLLILLLTLIENASCFTEAPPLKLVCGLPSDRAYTSFCQSCLFSRKDDNDTTGKDSIDDSDDDPTDAFVAEQEAGRKVAQRLMLPRAIATSISQAITALGWGFLITSFILQTLGYAFVSDNHGGFRIDTLEKLQFQEEIHRSLKDSMGQ